MRKGRSAQHSGKYKIDKRHPPASTRGNRVATIANRKGTNESDYVVGYGRPPKGTQFTAGKSGNPKGRRRGSRTVGAVLQHIIRQKIAVTENGKTRRLPVLEVMLRRLANDAMRNDPRAVKLLLSLCDRFGASPETEPALDAMLAEDQAILTQFLQQTAALVPDPD